MRRVTTLLTPEVVARAERLTLATRRRLTARGAGGHRSARSGRSLEFKDHRPYAKGDDVRQLDWSLLARTRRPWLRVYHDEEEQHVVLLVDASASMAFEDKLLRARQLAAAIAAMVLRAGDRVSAHAFGGGTPLRGTPAMRGRAGLSPLFTFLEGVEAASGQDTLERALTSLTPRLGGRGAVVMLSDFLTHGDLSRAANLVAGAGFEPIGVQILGPSELAPELQDDVRLVDSETDTFLDVAASDDVLAYYHAALRTQERRLADLCAGRGGRFTRVDASVDPLATLFGPLRRGGIVR
ncbi:MAG: DUF58 domain-containing protein [Planctomycetota bacterium]